LGTAQQRLSNGSRTHFSAFAEIARENRRAAEQINGREAKTATLSLFKVACVFAHVISTVISLLFKSDINLGE
jgi:hypothetical protein